MAEQQYIEPIMLVYSRLDRPAYYMWPFGVLTLRGLIYMAVGGLVAFFAAANLIRVNMLLAIAVALLIPGVLLVLGRRQSWPPPETRVVGLLSYLFAPRGGGRRPAAPPREITVRAGEGGFVDFTYPAPWPDGTVVSVYIHGRRVMRTRVVNGEVYVRAIIPKRNTRYLVKFVAGKKKTIKFWVRVI